MHLIGQWCFLTMQSEKCTYRRYKDNRSMRKSAMVIVRFDNVESVVGCYVGRVVAVERNGCSGVQIESRKLVKRSAGRTTLL
jgi:hypothetical protein